MDADELKEASKTLNAFDKNALYEKNIYTDMACGEISVLTPVTSGRVRDTKRPMRYFSSVVLMINGQQMTVNFEIAASGLEEACDRYTEAATKAANAAIEKIQDAQRRVLVPGTAASKLAMN